MTHLLRLFLVATLTTTLGSCGNLLDSRATPVDPRPSPSPDPTPAPAPLSMILSGVTVGATSVAVGGVMGVTVLTRDTNGKSITVSGLTVSVVYAGGSSLGLVASVTDNMNGVYTTTLTGVSAGTASSLVGSIGSSPLLQNPVKVTVTPTLWENAEPGTSSSETPGRD